MNKLEILWEKVEILFGGDKNNNGEVKKSKKKKKKKGLKI